MGVYHQGRIKCQNTKPQGAEELLEVTADIVRRLSSGSMRILIQAPDFVGISTFTDWSFPDIVPSKIF